MRKLILATATAAIGLAAAPAFAQDVAGAPFTGLRVEGLVGYDNLRDGSEGNSDGRDGVVYGAAVGYDVQVGGAVLGIEGEITDSSTNTRTGDLIATGDDLRLDAGRDLYAGARLGFAINPRTLAYVKGGYSNARLESRYSVGNTVVEDDSDLEGYRLGAGLEFAVSGNAYVKGEYRYSHYGNLEDYDVDLDRHQILAGVGVRF
ncbi:MAG TPA: outer membrane beta-barrel protein [Sphingomonas sp.]|jgi:outer membrane immunogenic protein|nr:outer membrane beta-barrel protein [Sphingomonas sp.]